MQQQLGGGEIGEGNEMGGRDRCICHGMLK